MDLSTKVTESESKLGPSGPVLNPVSQPVFHPINPKPEPAPWSSFLAPLLKARLVLEV